MRTSLPLLKLQIRVCGACFCIPGKNGKNATVTGPSGLAAAVMKTRKAAFAAVKAGVEREETAHGRAGKHWMTGIHISISNFSFAAFSPVSVTKNVSSKPCTILFKQGQDAAHALFHSYFRPAAARAVGRHGCNRCPPWLGKPAGPGRFAQSSEKGQGWQ